MRAAAFYDIHGNLPALEAVRALLRASALRRALERGALQR